MPLRVHQLNTTSTPTDVKVGSTQVTDIYAGSQLIWQHMNWLFVDDFNRSTLGSNRTSTGGAVLVNGQLKKNTTHGSADNWTVQTFPSDNLHVSTTLGEVTDPVQACSIALGSPSQYVYCEISTTGGQIGDYNGSVWTKRANVPALPWAAGDKFEMIRVGATVGVYRNSTLVAQGSSSVAAGPSFRRVNLSVRVYVAGITRYYSPTFDDVRIRVYPV